MNEAELILRDALNRMVPAKSEVYEWNDILVRSGTPSTVASTRRLPLALPRARRASLRPTHRRLLLIALGVVVVAVAAVAGAIAYVVSSPAPGLSAGVSSLDRLPPVPNLPPNVAFFIERSASAFGEDPDKAKERVRLLRSGLGTMKSDLYAYRREDRAVCLVVTHSGGTCARHLAEGSPGVELISGGGYPAWAHPRLYPNGVPRSVVGVVADSVLSTTLVVGGGRVPLPIINNAIFSEYPPNANPQGRVALEVQYIDGTRRVFALP